MCGYRSFESNNFNCFGKIKKFGSGCFHRKNTLTYWSFEIINCILLLDYSLKGGIKMREVKDEVMKTIATLVTTAFGLIAALAWNEAIKAIIGCFSRRGLE